MKKLLAQFFLPFVFFIVFSFTLGFPTQAQAGALTINSHPALTSTYVNALTSMTVTFTTAGTIVANGDIQITFPTGFDLTSIGSSGTSEAQGDGGTLTTSISGQVLTVNCGSQINASTSVALTISNVKNPSSSGATGTFAIETQDASDVAVDTGTGNAVTISVTYDATGNQKISDTAGNFTATLDNADFLGYSVASLGDLNKDGVEDLAMGAYGDDDGSTDRGAVYVLFMNTDGTVNSHQKISDTDGNFTKFFANSDYFGWSLAGGHDINRDGVKDLVVGAKWDDDGGFNRGGITTLFLNTNGTVSSYQVISDTSGNFTATLANSDELGSSIAIIGDLNRDNILDYAVGAREDDTGGTGRGALYILFMKTDGTVNSYQKISDTDGNFTATLDNSDLFGNSVTALGDVDQDGVLDLAVGAHQDDDGLTDNGAVYVLFMNTDGTVKSHQKISDTDGGFSATFAAYDLFGSSVAGVGDVDKNGIPDLAVGFPGEDAGGTARGGFYLLLLQSNGTVASYNTYSDTAGNFTGTLANLDYFGTSLAKINDLDGDDTYDLFVGTNADDDGGLARGAGWVVNMDATALGALTITSQPAVANNYKSATSSFTVTFTTTSYIPNGGDIQIDFPVGFDLTAVGSSDTTEAQGDGGTLTTTVAGQRVTIDSSSMTGINAGTSMALTIADVKNPPDGGVTYGDFAIQTQNATDVALDEGTGDGIFIAPGALTINTQPAVANTLASATSNFTVTFTVANQIPANGDIQITFPSGFDLGSVGSGDSSEAQSDGGTLTTSVASQVLTINCGSSIAANTSIALTIANVKNPSTGGTTGTFAIQTQTASDATIDEGTGNGIFISTYFATSSYQKISDTAGNFTATLTIDKKFGGAAAKIGDLDGDGVTDYAVGLPEEDDGGFYRGAIYVLFMKTDGTVNSYQKISDTAGNFTATIDDVDQFGFSVTGLGDLDGDGVVDLAVGANWDDDGGVSSDRGAVYVLFMKTDGTVNSYQKISDTAGNFTATFNDYGYFGNSVANMGDLNGDAVIDLAVGVSGDSDGGTGRGAVYLLFMNTDGTVSTHQKISDTAGNFTATLDNNDFFGSAVAKIGDVNGDGIQDLAVGANGDDDGGDGGALDDKGAVYVLFMKTDGTVNSYQKISDTEGGFTATFYGSNNFGISSAGLGDINHDGTSDILVGATYDNDGGDFRGAAYIIYLKTDGTAKAYDKFSDTAGNFTATLDDADFLGYSVAAVGDLNGDGSDDIVLGATGDDDGDGNVGAIYTLFLTSSSSVSTIGALNITAHPAVATNTTTITSNFTLTFTTATTITANGDVQIDFPVGFILTGVGSSDTTEAQSDGGTLTTSVNGQRITINCGSQINAGTSVALTIANVTNPSTAGSYGTFAIQTQNATDTPLDEGTGNAITIDPNTLTINTHPAVVNTAVSATSNFTVTFTIASAIPADGDIQITFPSGFVLTAVGAADTSEAQSDGGTLTTSVASQVVTINCGSSVAADTSMALTIIDVQNPSSSGATGTFAMETQNASDTTLDTGTGNAVTITNNRGRFRIFE